MRNETTTPNSIVINLSVFLSQRAPANGELQPIPASMPKPSAAENETRIFWLACEDLYAAKRRNDAEALRFAADEIACIWLHTDSDAIRASADRTLTCEAPEHFVRFVHTLQLQ